LQISIPKCSRYERRKKKKEKGFGTGNQNLFFLEVEHQPSIIKKKTFSSPSFLQHASALSVSPSFIPIFFSKIQNNKHLNSSNQPQFTQHLKTPLIVQNQHQHQHQHQHLQQQHTHKPSPIIIIQHQEAAQSVIPVRAIID